MGQLRPRAGHPETKTMKATENVCVDRSTPNSYRITRARVRWDAEAAEELKANARLIAAAPELLAQVQSAHAWLGIWITHASETAHTELANNLRAERVRVSTLLAQLSELR